MRTVGDLVVISLSGVQRFIAESYSTADLANASDIMVRLARTATEQFAPEERVFPSAEAAQGVPNRIVAVVAEKSGTNRASAAAGAVRDQWRECVARVFDDTVEVPGFPEVYWSVAEAGTGDYAAQWREAHVALAARKRLRGFDAPEYSGRQPCSIAPRWSAHPSAPAGVPDHQRDSQLSVAAWIKRRWHDHPSLPSSSASGLASSAAIASAPYRAAVLKRWDESAVRGAVKQLHAAATTVMGRDRSRVLESAVPGLVWDRKNTRMEWLVRGAGTWVYPTAWQLESLRREYAVDGHTVTEEAVEKGHRAATDLGEALGDATPSTYYALLASDVDGMGEFLSRPPVDAPSHRAVSAAVEQVARDQTQQVEQHLGVGVYVGGDDLLALLPAREAIAAARACRRVLQTQGGLPSASTAVMLVHYRSSLRAAITQVRALLARAKAVPRKDAVAVGFTTGSGTTFSTVRPWRSPDWNDALEPLQIFTAPGAQEQEGALSPRLVSDLERSRRGLAELAEADHRVYAKEIERLVGRHGGSPTDATRLVALGRTEHQGAHPPVPIEAARVAVFLRRECR